MNHLGLRPIDLAEKTCKNEVFAMDLYFDAKTVKKTDSNGNLR